MFLENVNAMDILDDPSRMLNADESGFCLCPKTGTVLGLKGLRNVYEVKGNSKENLTVLVTFTADGRMCPPVVIFPYVKPPRSIVESMPPFWILGKSDSGWMRSDIFFEFVANGLNDWLKQQEIKRPVLFLVDGHRSHMSLQLSEFCDQNGIILYALPPNATHLLQPADVSVFKPLKEYWRQAVRQWQYVNSNRTVTKADFCPVFKDVLEHPKMPGNIRNGFKACGLFPFDPNAPDYSKCVQNKLEALNMHEKEKTQDLTYTDVISTIRVLTTIKSTCSDQGIDVNPLITIVTSLKQTLSEKEKEKENQIEKEGDAARIQEYEVAEDGFLRPVDETDPFYILHQPELPPMDLDVTENASEFRYEEQFNSSINESSQELDIDVNFFNDLERMSPNPSGSLLLSSSTTIEAQENMATKEDCMDPISEVEQNFSSELPPQLDSTISKNKETTPQRNISPTVEDNKMKSPELDDSTISKNSNTPERAITPVLEISKTIPGNIVEDNVSPFTKHLKFPGAIEKSKKTPRLKLPSAISSDAWRKHYNKKQVDKEGKESAKKRRREETERRKAEKNKKTRKAKETGEPRRKKVARAEKAKVREKCARCSDYLISEAEDDEDKNIGCDLCPQWFHMKCTAFQGRKYEEVYQEEFICDQCVQN